MMLRICVPMRDFQSMVGKESCGKRIRSPWISQIVGMSIFAAIASSFSLSRICGDFDGDEGRLKCVILSGDTSLFCAAEATIGIASHSLS